MATVTTTVTDAVKEPLAPKNRGTVIIIVAIALGVWWFFFRGRQGIASAGDGEEPFTPLTGGVDAADGIDTPIDDSPTETDGQPGSIGVPLDPRILESLKDAVGETLPRNGGGFLSATGGSGSEFGFSSFQLDSLNDLAAGRNVTTLGDPEPEPPPRTPAPPKGNQSGSIGF